MYIKQHYVFMKSTLYHCVVVMVTTLTRISFDQHKYIYGEHILFSRTKYVCDPEQRVNRTCTCVNCFQMKIFTDV